MEVEKGSTLVAADRHEVPFAGGWDDESGSDFFFEPDAAQIAGTGNIEDLSDRGWTTTSLSFVNGTGAKFLDRDNLGVPAHFATNAAGDLLESPEVFGDYVHGHQAGHHLGGDPTTLTFESWCAFSVHSANETATGLGFFINGGSIVTADNAVAVIHTDGTNFTLRSNADSDVGALDDALWHQFKIVITMGSLTDAIEWFIDDVSQGFIDLRDDAMPVGVGWGNVGAGTNRVLIGSCEVLYR